ncbi:hypothetical protein F5X99DRAFT_418586 [Biscogniauxia marginata]|nr:hypothetical protein F5X99DRAFT_418586 [Biscogniauxia marginata]
MAGQVKVHETFDNEGSDDVKTVYSEVEGHKNIIFSGPRHVQPLDRLRGEITFPKAKPDTLRDIKETIQRAIVAKDRAIWKYYMETDIYPQTSIVTYTVDWDIMAFLHEQDYTTLDFEAVVEAITLTGTLTEAQALSCRQYIKKVWPLSGLQTLHFVQQLLRNGGSSKCPYVCSSGQMALEGFFDGALVIVVASGDTESVIEIGEQLAWLSAALRCSPLDHGVVYCTPYVEYDVTETQEKRCDIKHHIEICDTKSPGTNGKCWHRLFTNPRGEVDIGARYIDTFKSKRSDDLIIWHLLYNDDPNERISYLDCNIEHADVSVTDLEQSRHILAGTTRASYNIGKSNLPYSHSRFALEKAEISAGQFVTGMAAFKLGNKEKPIASRYFVFWDEEDKRGWLVNGASTLLHILRASLEHSKRKFQSAWLLDPSILGDATNPSRLDSALKLYLDNTETNIIVSRRQTRHYRLEDRIEYIYNILEKLIDQRADAERRPGLDINLRPRRYLEGWDFKGIVMDGDPFFSRVATLQTIGKGWVDFTQGIHAVTLFGRGFGKLFQPQQTTTNTPCPPACVSDLQHIMEKDGDSNSNPRRLCDNIIWHMKQATFDSCPCTRGIMNKHNDPKLQKKHQVNLQDQGAVIFGHNINLHWHWKDAGDPVKGDPPPELGATQSLSPLSNNGSIQSPGNDYSTASDNSSRGKSISPRNLSESVPEGASGSSKRRLHNVFSSVSKKAKY